MKTCDYSQCDKPIKAKNLCRAHYELQRVRRLCMITGCNQLEKAKQLCPMHYMRVKIHGRADVEIRRGTRHGLHCHPMYRRWKDIKSRCNNPGTKAYKNYGGRGIKLSKEFLDPAKFIKYVTKLDGYGVEGLTLDRINNDRGYKRGNLRWATRSIQRANQRIKGV